LAKKDRAISGRKEKQTFSKAPILAKKDE